MLEIRQATSKDLDQLTQWTHQLHLHEDDKSVASHPEIKPRLKKWLAAELSNNNGLFLIAEANGSPVAFIYANSIINDNGFLASPMKGVIHLLWVDEQHRGKNIATRLTDAVETVLENCRSVTLNVHLPTRTSRLNRFGQAEVMKLTLQRQEK